MTILLFLNFHKYTVKIMNNPAFSLSFMQTFLLEILHLNQLDNNMLINIHLLTCSLNRAYLQKVTYTFRKKGNSLNQY